jgi:hypothetical protein
MKPISEIVQRTRTYSLGNDSQGFARDYRVIHSHIDTDPVDYLSDKVKVLAYTIGTGPAGVMDSLEIFREVAVITRPGKEPQCRDQTHIEIPPDISDKFAELPKNVRDLLQ